MCAPVQCCMRARPDGCALATSAGAPNQSDESPRLGLTGLACPANLGHMSRDMRAPNERDTAATIQLRLDRFELMTRVVGATTVAGRAELIGIDRKTMSRILNGSQLIGEVFIAKTVAALRRHADTLGECGLTPSLDELFEVVADAAEPALVGAAA